jgi:hypothetical protein
MAGIPLSGGDLLLHRIGSALFFQLCESQSCSLKRCWNRELDQAMDFQLKNRYLKVNQSRFGLYLVGWFNCPQWDKSDARKNRCAKITRNEAQEKFDSQAATLSADGATIKAFVLDTRLSS